MKSMIKISNIFILIFLIVFIVLFHPITNYAEDELSKIKGIIQPAIVKITMKGEDRLGVKCGVIIDTNGIILTMFLGGEENEFNEYLVEFPNGEKIPAKLHTYDSDLQHATLKVKKLNLVTVNITTNKPIQGQKVFAADLTDVISGTIIDDYKRFSFPKIGKMPGFFLSTDLVISSADLDTIVINKNKSMNLLFNSEGELISVWAVMNFKDKNTFFYPLTNFSENIMTLLK
jgi:S1-C subfamily serine protease